MARRRTSAERSPRQAQVHTVEPRWCDYRRALFRFSRHPTAPARAARIITVRTHDPANTDTTSNTTRSAIRSVRQVCGSSNPLKLFKLESLPRARAVAVPLAIYFYVKIETEKLRDTPEPA